MGKRALIVLLLLALAGIAARVAAPTTQRPLAVSRVLGCGTERWAVKTLQDRPRLLRLRTATIAQLVSIPRPVSVPSTRLSLERRVYNVLASAELIRKEADQDLHIVLRSGTKHLIVEAPNAPICTPNATAYRKKQMADARSKVRLCAQAHVVGVVFWDRPHHVTGRASNAIELHPILGFSCLSG